MLSTSILRKPRDFPSLARPLALKVAKIKTEGHRGRVRGKKPGEGR